MCVFAVKKKEMSLTLSAGEKKEVWWKKEFSNRGLWETWLIYLNFTEGKYYLPVRTAIIKCPKYFIIS